MEEIDKNKLAKELLEILVAKLREKIQNYRCEVCANTHWQAIEFVSPIPLSNGLNINLGGQILPLFPIACTNCGNTHFFNLGILGLIDAFKVGKEVVK
jgi:hypothetical protein